VTEATASLSDVSGKPRTMPVAVHPERVFAVTLAAQVMVGNSISVTATVCMQVALLPLLSVTVQVTVVMPIGKAEGASLVTDATPQLSDVVGVPRATPVAVLPKLVVVLILAGQEIVGNV
jgi:uncharacterized protein (UPF0261 family)